MFILIQIVFASLSLIEAKLFSISNKLDNVSDLNYTKLKREQNKWSLIHYIFIISLISYIAHYAGNSNLILIPILMSVRTLFYEFAVTIMEKGIRKIFVLDDGYVNMFLKKLIGKYVGQIKFLVSLILFIVLNLILTK